MSVRSVTLEQIFIRAQPNDRQIPRVIRVWSEHMGVVCDGLRTQGKSGEEMASDVLTLNCLLVMKVLDADHPHTLPPALFLAWDTFCHSVQWPAFASAVFGTEAQLLHVLQQRGRTGQIEAIYRATRQVMQQIIPGDIDAHFPPYLQPDMKFRILPPMPRLRAAVGESSFSQRQQLPVEPMLRVMA